jgi:hypothetical protein
MDALGLKTTGRSPPDALESVSPTFAMEQFYLAARIDTVGQAIAMGASLGAFTNINVPSGEAWIINAACLNAIMVTTGPFTVQQISLGVTVRNNFVRVAVNPFSSTFNVNGMMATATWVPDKITILPPGSNIQGRFDSGANWNGQTLEMDLWFTRLSV